VGKQSRQKKNVREMKKAWEAKYGPIEPEKPKSEETAPTYGRACEKCGQGITWHGAPICLPCVKGWNS
jgi:hypothetical protein